MAQSHSCLSSLLSALAGFKGAACICRPDILTWLASTVHKNRHEAKHLVGLRPVGKVLVLWTSDRVRSTCWRPGGPIKVQQTRFNAQNLFFCFK